MQTIVKRSGNSIPDTSKHIIDTARKFFSEFSYLGVSMDDIAKKLDITKAALYYHFTSKAEIYEKVIDEVFFDLNLTIDEAINETTIDKKLHKLIKNYLDFGFKEQNLIKSMAFKLLPADKRITKHIIESRKRIIALIQPIVEETLSNRKLAEITDSQLLTSMLTSMMDGMILEYSLTGKKINSAKISDQIIAILFKVEALPALRA